MMWTPILSSTHVPRPKRSKHAGARAKRAKAKRSRK